MEKVLFISNSFFIIKLLKIIKFKFFKNIIGESGGRAGHVPGWASSITNGGDEKKK